MTPSWDGFPTGVPFRAAWSYNGSHVAYHSLSGGAIPGRTREFLTVRSMETGEVRELFLPVDAGYPRSHMWAPDGRALLVHLSNERDGDAITSLDVRTGRLEPVVSYGRADRIRSFDMTPDGEVSSRRIRTREAP
jgi:hypothetical protein